MKILVIGNNYDSCTGDISEEKEICEAMSAIGNKAIFVDRDKWRELNDEEFDIIFVAKYVKNNSEAVVEMKKKFSGKVVYWMPDHCPFLGKDSVWDKVFENVDVWLGRDLDEVLMSNINKLDGNYHYWNFDVACNLFKKEDPGQIHLFAPQTKFPEVTSVLFVGNWIHEPQRMIFLHKVQKAYPDEMYVASYTMNEYIGGQFNGKESEYKLHNVCHPLFGSNFNKLIGITKINISIDWVNMRGFWSPRTARIMAAGGFVIAKYVEGMEETFGDSGENLVYCHSVKECIDLIKYYLENEEERKAIAERGYNFVNKNMRPEKRVGELITYLKNNL